MLHTIISLGDVLPQPQERAYETVEYKNGYVTCENTPSGKVVERLISTDPFDYLKKEFMPGTPYGNRTF